MKVKSFGELPYAFNEVADSVYCVAEDRDGANWVGTDNGVFVFTPSIDKFKPGRCPVAMPQRFFPLGGRVVFVLNSDPFGKHSRSSVSVKFTTLEKGTCGGEG